MDHMQDGIMQGSIEGTVGGGAKLVAGRHGNAIQMDGSVGYVEIALDSENKCLQNPDMCSSGVTFSMWLMTLSGNSPDSVFRIVRSKACIIDLGFCVTLYRGTFGIMVLGSSLAYRYRIPSLPINKWQYVTLSFMPGDGIQLYINGCDAVTYRMEGYPLITTFTPVSGNVSTHLRLGGKSSNEYAAHMKVDHVLIWYDTLNADEIWHLYLQGGIIWYHYFGLRKSISISKCMV